MILIINTNQYDENNIYFGEKSVNNIISNSYFYNIIYTNHLFTIHHLYIKFTLQDIFIEKYFNKFKISFKNNNNINQETIYNLKHIENSILTTFNNNITKVTNLQEQLDNNTLKCVSKNNIITNYHSSLNFAIKISGIWKNYSEIGLIYKIMII